MPILSITIIPPIRWWGFTRNPSVPGNSNNWCWHDATSVPCKLRATGIPVYHVIIMLSTYIPPLDVYIICIEKTYDTSKNMWTSLNIYIYMTSDISVDVFWQLHGAHCFARFAIHVGGEPLSWELGLNMILSDRNDGKPRTFCYWFTQKDTLGIYITWIRKRRDLHFDYNLTKNFIVIWQSLAHWFNWFNQTPLGI